MQYPLYQVRAGRPKGLERRWAPLYLPDQEAKGQLLLLLLWDKQNVAYIQLYPSKFQVNPYIFWLKLKGLLAEIREIIYERLLVTPLEQKQKIEYIKELILKEKTNNELIKKLKEEVHLATMSKDKDVCFYFLNVLCMSCSM